MLLVQEQSLLWEVAFIRAQQGSGLTPQDKGQEAESKRAMVAATGFAAKGIMTFLSLPHLLSFHLYIITLVYQSPGAFCVHRGFIASLERSLWTGPSVRLPGCLSCAEHQEPHKPWRSSFLHFVCHRAK